MTPPVIFLAKQATFIRGCYPGLRQPSLMMFAAITPRAKTDLAAVDAAMAACIKNVPDRPDSGIDTPTRISAALLYWACALQREAGLPVFSNGLAFATGSGQHTLILPCSDRGLHLASRSMMEWVIAMTNRILVGQSTESLRSRLPALMNTLRSSAPQGMNTVRFLQAAYDRSIPWQRFSGNIYQFGWGAKARLLDSSFTDATPVISASIARSKIHTAAVLKRAGLPIPAHELARDAVQAVAIAEKLGYPVVVKPSDQDGGAGVASGLKGPSQVRAAFDAARKLSQSVLVEKHFDGNDYRLQVFCGEVIWVSHRVPGGVTGDGEQTVTALLLAQNADPLRGPVGSNALLKRIDLNAEALEMLEEQGLDKAAIPCKGQFVRLRRAANVASGGVPVPVLDDAHPDNIALAIRAARLLRLDLAGIDLLIPDIRQSWLESGAIICEVNAQPQLSPSLPGRLLERLVKGQGRIPVFLVLGRIDNAWRDALVSSLEQTGCILGVAGPDGASAGGRKLIKEARSPLDLAEALLLDPSVEVLLVLVEDPALIQSGLPFDCFDALVLSTPPSKSEAAYTTRNWSYFIKTIQKVCTGPIYVNKAHLDWPQWLTRSDQGHIRFVDPSDIVKGLSETLLAARYD